MSDTSTIDEPERKVKLQEFHFQRRFLFGCTISLIVGTILWIIAMSTNRWFIVTGGQGGCRSFSFRCWGLQTFFTGKSASSRFFWSERGTVQTNSTEINFCIELSSNFMVCCSYTSPDRFQRDFIFRRIKLLLTRKNKPHRFYWRNVWKLLFDCIIMSECSTPLDQTWFTLKRVPQVF